jgi:hypothetical protein
MSVVLHQSLKDARQHRWLLLAWLGVIVFRAALVAFPCDVRVRAVAPSGLANLYFALGIAALALPVVLSVLVVQGDPGDGTTAFWLTRPIGRGAMAVSKLVTVLALCVAAPILLDVAVLAANGLPLEDVRQAVAHGLIERLALLLPTLALAAVTRDLAGFALAALAGLAAMYILLLAALLSERAVSIPQYESSFLVNLVLGVVVGVTILLVQYRRRERRWSIGLAAAALIGVALVTRFWTADLLADRRRADPSIAGTAGVRVGTTGPYSVRRVEGRDTVEVLGVLATSSARPTIVATPSAIDAKLVVGDGRVVVYRSPDRLAVGALSARGGGVVVSGGGPPGLAAMGAALGSIRVRPDVAHLGTEQISMMLMRLDAWDADAVRALGGRYEASVELRAVDFQAGGALPLRAGATGVAGGRRSSVLDATCSDGRCEVLLRDVVAAFTYDWRGPSRVDYLLVHRRRGVALLPEVRSSPVLGVGGGVPFGHHLAITHRTLRYEAGPVQVDETWLAESELVPIVARDRGAFTKPLVIANFGEILGTAPGAAGREGGR